MTRSNLDAASRALPLFPLPGLVLMPGNLLPLHVFEPRYRQLVADCLRTGGPLSVPEIDPVRADPADPSPPFLPYAGLGLITAHEGKPDGRSTIVIEPIGRVRIVEELFDTGPMYRVGRAQLLEDVPVPEGAIARSGERLRGLMGSVLARVGGGSRGLAEALHSLSAERVTDAVARIVLKEPQARQDFLREDHPLHRAAAVEQALLLLLAESRGNEAEA